MDAQQELSTPKFTGINYESFMNLVIGSSIIIPADAKFFMDTDLVKGDDAQTLRDLLYSYLYHKEFTFLSVQVADLRENGDLQNNKENKDLHDEYESRLEELRKLERRTTVTANL